MKQSVYEGALSAACYDGYLQSLLFQCAQQCACSVHQSGTREGGEDACLLVVHPLCLLEGDVFVLLLFYEVAYGVDASCSLRHVGIFGSHSDAEGRHRPVPRYGVKRHGVDEYPVHIEKHGLGLKVLKAMLSLIVLN